MAAITAAKRKLQRTGLSPDLAYVLNQEATPAALAGEVADRVRTCVAIASSVDPDANPDALQHKLWTLDKALSYPDSMR